MKFQKTFLITSTVFMLLNCTACSPSTELESTTYYLNGNNNDLVLIVSDIKDENPADGTYYRTCMIQFSGTDVETYIEEWQHSWADYFAWVHAINDWNGHPAGHIDEFEEAQKHYVEVYENTLDLKKQFVDNPCKFYIYDIVDDEFDSVYTQFIGIDIDFYWELVLDSDGSMILSVCSRDNEYIFKKR